MYYIATKQDDGHFHQSWKGEDIHRYNLTEALERYRLAVSLRGTKNVMLLAHVSVDVQVEAKLTYPEAWER